MKRAGVGDGARIRRGAETDLRNGDFMLFHVSFDSFKPFPFSRGFCLLRAETVSGCFSGRRWCPFFLNDSSLFQTLRLPFVSPVFNVYSGSKHR